MDAAAPVDHAPATADALDHNAPDEVAAALHALAVKVDRLAATQTELVGVALQLAGAVDRVQQLVLDVQAHGLTGLLRGRRARGDD